MGNKLDTKEKQDKKIGDRFGLTIEQARAASGDIFTLLQDEHGLSMAQGAFIVTAMTCSALDVLRGDKEQEAFNLLVQMIIEVLGNKK